MMLRSKRELSELSKPDNCIWILFSLVFLAVAVGSLYSLTRYYTLRSGLLDIGAYVHVLTAINRDGVPLTTLTLLTAEQHWFGFHFSPILYVFAPMARIFDPHLVLNLSSVLLIALAAIPIFFASISLGISRISALLIATAYLFNPFTFNAMIWGFHETNLSALWMSIALWALITRRMVWLIAASVLLLLTKEHYGASVAALGFLWWWRYRTVSGIYLIAGGLLALVVVMGMIMPVFRGDESHPLLSTAMQNRYGWLVTPDQWPMVLRALLLDNLKYAVLLFASFLFLPVGGLIWLLAGVSDFAVNMLSNFNMTYRSPFSFYSVGLMPVLAIAAAQGALFLRNMGISRLLLAPGAVLSLCYFSYFSLMPLPLSRDIFELSPVPQLALSSEDALALQSVKQQLDRKSHVAVSDTVGYLFSTDFRYLYIFPTLNGSLQGVDQIVVHLKAPLEHSPSQIAPSGMTGLLEAVRGIINDRETWKVIFVDGNWVVFSRNGLEHMENRAKAIAAYNALLAQQTKLYESFYRAMEAVNYE